MDTHIFNHSRQEHCSIYIDAPNFDDAVAILREIVRERDNWKFTDVMEGWEDGKDKEHEKRIVNIASHYETLAQQHMVTKKNLETLATAYGDLELKCKELEEKAWKYDQLCK